MRIAIASLFAVASLAAVPLAVRAQENAGPERRAIEQANHQLEQWYRAGQIDSVVRHFSENAWQMPNRVPPLAGREAIRQFWTQAVSWGEWTFSLNTEEVLVSGDLAAERGTYTLRYVPGKAAPKEMSAPTEDQGNYVVVWRKEGDGKWRILWDVPSSAPPAGAPQS